MVFVNNSNVLIGCVSCDELYRQSYEASITVIRNIIPFLSSDEMVRRGLLQSVRMIPCILATDLKGSFASRRAGAVDEAMRRCREVIVMLSYCRDIHDRFINGRLCDELIRIYGDVAAHLEGLIETEDKSPGGAGC